jgi:hypothetical protein
MHGRIIMIDKMPLGGHYWTRVEFIEFGSGQLVIEYRSESFFIDVWEQRTKVCIWVTRENGSCRVVQCAHVVDGCDVGEKKGKRTAKSFKTCL